MQSFNLIEMWHSMAPLAKAVNVLLGICSVYSLWVIIDRFFALRSVKRRSVAFVFDLRDQLKRGDLDGAREIAKAKNDSPIARLVHEALVEYREGTALLQAGPYGGGGDYDPVEAIERVIERTKERETADLKRGLGGLASISSAAPFIGLFGTVIGIINAFRSMAATGQGGLGAVSAGISEALFTTAVGLSVAIPAVMTFNYFTSVIDRYVVDMNGVGSELLSFVLREEAAAAPRLHPASPQPYPSQPPPPVHPSHPPPPVHPSQYPPQYPHSQPHPHAGQRGSVHPQPPSQRPSGHGPAGASGYPPGYRRR
jgi:biopolymer transport protein ExbB/TolQ